MRSPPGSVTLIRFADDPAQSTAHAIALPTELAVPGALRPEDERSLERAVDGEEVLVPLRSSAPDWVEPEMAAFSPDGSVGYVTLQEHNAVLVIDVEHAAIAAVHGLGLPRHTADLLSDGQIEFAAEILALREPDGIAVTPDGRYFVTADEGDTDPKVGRTPAGLPVGGGRTLSVFATETGRLVGDTGNQLDQWAADAGLYPDGRSAAKGSEPEMVVSFELLGRIFAAVALERADAVALVDLSTPREPRVVAISAVGPDHGDDSHGPEGLTHYRDPRTGLHWLFVANERSGTVAVLRVGIDF